MLRILGHGVLLSSRQWSDKTMTNCANEEQVPAMVPTLIGFPWNWRSWRSSQGGTLGSRSFVAPGTVEIQNQSLTWPWGSLKNCAVG